MKILLFGGTFDPPHNGHMNNLRAALELIQPDRAIVMPAGTPPHKTASATPAETRLAMCECFKTLSPVVEVSNWEIEQGGRSYTVNTLQMLREQNPDAELYLTVGSDMLLSFTGWHNWQQILQLATLVVVSRVYGDKTELANVAKMLQERGGRVLFASAETYPCSSRAIRTGRIPRSQWAKTIPAEALAVIQKEALYRSEES